MENNLLQITNNYLADRIHERKDTLHEYLLETIRTAANSDWYYIVINTCATTASVKLLKFEAQ